MISPYIYPGLKDQFRATANSNFKKNSITSDEILKIISEHCNVTVEEVVSRTRKKEKVDARHIFCAIMRKQFGYTYSSIGELIGDRDHTTVINSVRKFDDRVATEDNYKILVSNILYNIKANMK